MTDDSLDKQGQHQHLVHKLILFNKNEFKLIKKNSNLFKFNFLFNYNIYLLLLYLFINLFFFLNINYDYFLYNKNDYFH